MALIEKMAAIGGPTGVSELARAVGYSRGTVHKQLSTLVASGWAEQQSDGRYCLSLLVARIGNAALQQAHLGQKVQHILREVVDRSGECVTVAALHNREALIIQRAEATQVLNANIRVGSTIPLASSASSLVLLAFATTAEQREYWRGENVVLPVESQIEAVVDAGFASTTDDFLAGVTAVSIPLDEELTLSTTALTMVGPKERLNIDAVLPVLYNAREQIRALGRNLSRC